MAGLYTRFLSLVKEVKRERQGGEKGADGMNETDVLQRLIRGVKLLRVRFVMPLLRTAKRQTSPALVHHFPIIF
jgi:hypothetical protein